MGTKDGPASRPTPRLPCAMLGTVTSRVVFVHGAGRAGAAAWPVQRAGRLGQLFFIERYGFRRGEERQPTDFDEDQRRVLEEVGGEAHLVAHSYGAIAALMAAQAAPDRIRSVTLFEPACFSLARGHPAIEAHVDAAGGALADPALSDEEFLDRFLRSLGSKPPPGPLSAAARESARRLRLQRGPWEAVLNPAIIASKPTLVVTSGESELSEAVAAAMAALGAQRVLVPGTGHRPQDDPSANQLLLDFWATSELNP